MLFIKRLGELKVLRLNLSFSKKIQKYLQKSFEIISYALFVCDHYFIQYGIIQVCIFYLYSFGKLFFLFFLTFLRFLPVSCRIRCNLHKPYNNCIIIVCITGVRNYVFVFSLYQNQFVKIDISSQKFDYALNKKNASRGLLSFKNSNYKEKCGTFTKSKSEKTLSTKKV